MVMVARRTNKTPRKPLTKVGEGGKERGGSCRRLWGGRNVANAAAANRLTTFLPMTLREKTLRLPLPLALALPSTSTSTAPFGGRRWHPPEQEN